MSTVNCKFCCDAGQGSLKLCLSIQSPYRKNSDDSPRRHIYEEGIVPKTFADSGVKKLIVIEIAPDCKEIYNNIKILFESIDIQNVNGVYASDLKLANLLCGLGPYSSTFPCTWCFAHRDKI